MSDFRLLPGLRWRALSDQLLRLKHRNWRVGTRAGTVGLCMLLVVFGIALTAPLIAPYDPEKIDISLRLAVPTASHPFGNDVLGRDVLSRMIHGVRVTLAIGLLSVGLGMFVGTVLGGIAGYIGGWVDEVISRGLDIVMGYPSTFLGLAIVMVVGASFGSVIFAVGIISIPIFARVTRSSVLTIRERDYIIAARSSGCSESDIFFRYVLPNAISPLIVLTTTYVATAITQAAGLSFLGLGVQPPTPELGIILSEGREYLLGRPYLSVWPGLAITFMILGFSLFGDGLRDYLDPRLRHTER